jgi:hypothetical protein
MNRSLSTVSLILLVLLAGGCPYDAKAPLGDPDPARFDKGLLGSWSGEDTKDGSPVQVLVLPFNTTEYYIELRDKEDTVTRLRAYQIEVAGRPLLQINEIDPDGAAPQSYTLARYSIGADSAITVHLVGEQIVPKEAAADPKALREFLTAHWEDPALDDPDTGLILRPSRR